MRYILALIIAASLLLAESAWAGEYDGEWSGSGIVTCGWGSGGFAPFDLRFVVDGQTIVGTFNGSPLTGKINGHRIDITAFDSPTKQDYITILKLSGSLKSGDLQFKPGTQGCFSDNTKVTRVEDPFKKAREQIAKEQTAPHKFDVLDAPYVALKNANVRERPDVESTRVATLSKGSEVTALGKVKDKNWYLVSRDGKKLGYVFGTLLSELETEPETRVTAVPEVTQAIKAPENKDAVAVIIGNRNYEGDIAKVAYAHNDADAIRTFVTDLLGHDPDNIIDLRDATKAKIEATFGNERSHQGKLWSYLDAKGGSDVVIYYSGHGVPGQKDQRGYLLPTNADPDHPEINGYPLDVLYANLGKMEARSITVLLDACFSGGSHQGMLIRSASPILVTGREIHEGSGQIVVLTAASGDQLASWDEKAKHGLFTRYFLEAVYGAADADGDRQIELEEIKTYLDRTMTRRARRDFRREQEAWISGAPDTVLVQLGSQQN